MTFFSQPRSSAQGLVQVLTLITASCGLLLAGAWYFEIVVGLLPCKLCLEQRWPHYAVLAFGLPVLAAHVAGRMSERMLKGTAVVLAGLMVVSFGMGGYHAGVEWGWFAGPSDCGGAAPAAAGSMGDFLKQLQTTRVVSCTEAAWRLAGLSLAGWNAVLSLALAAAGGYAVVSVNHDQGSSSLSQYR